MALPAEEGELLVSSCIGGGVVLNNCSYRDEHGTHYSKDVVDIKGVAESQI